MSIELILAIIFFGLLPLVERLNRAARESQGGTARPAPPPWAPTGEDEDDEELYAPGPPPMPMPAPRMPAPHVEKPRVEKPVPLTVKPAPVTPRVAPSRAPSRVTAHDRRTDDAFKGARKGRARRDIAAALHSEAGLRRAVVLMTILGPCRALSPYDGRQR